MSRPTASQLSALAQSPILLVACDFDGTLAVIAEHPEAAAPAQRAARALQDLAMVPRTYGAVLSGRSLADLSTRIPSSPTMLLVGGHGAEHQHRPSIEQGGRREAELLKSLRSLAAEYPGTVLEPKPAGPALHYRHVESGLRDRLLAAAEQIGNRHGVVPLRHGLLVVEFPLVRSDKGDGLRELVRRTGASTCVYFGDDTTDEDAFAVIHAPNLGVKVGLGPTAAACRVANVEEVTAALEELLMLRREAIEADVLTPIDHHALLSDQRALALVDPRARVVWLGAPRADSPPLFASIVGGPRAGYFEVTPVEEPADAGAESAAPMQAASYDGASFIVTTTLGRVRVTDYLDCTGGRAFQRAGRTDLVRVIEGSGQVRITFAPRLNFGRISTRLRVQEDGLLVEGSVDPIALYAPGLRWIIEPEGSHHTAVAEVEIPSGGLVLEMRIGTSSLVRSSPEAQRRKATAAFWNGWAASIKAAPIHADLVRRSAMVIKSLCYGPTGAILAAGTTSLPEQLGGQRNWDYRFCWIRDAAMSAAALVRLGSSGHAMKFLDWMLEIVDELDTPERLRPIYTVSGGELGPEGEIADLAGYAQSRPVRVGNGAGHQVQLDVFGPVADLIALMAESGAPLTPDHRRLLDAMVRAVARRWREPDHGIWEVRGPLRHHVHSKALCWHAVDRAMRARQLLGEPPREEEAALREEIRDDVLRRGYDARVGAFTAAYGVPELDAAALLVGLTGLVQPRDERFVSTVRAVERHLRVGDGVLRYRYDDGLEGSEGVFHLCTGWLIESLHLIGEVDRARTMLDVFASQAGPLGLYAEERDPFTGQALGNYPQAYSHVAIINAVVRVGGLK